MDLCQGKSMRDKQSLPLDSSALRFMPFIALLLTAAEDLQLY